MLNFKQIKVIETLKENNANVFLFISEVNRFWLTQFQSSFGYLIFSPEKIDLYLDGRYYEDAKSKINIPNLQIHLFKDLTSILDDLKSKKVNRILVEEEFFLLDEYNHMKNYFEQIIPCSTKKMRIEKDANEITNLKMAAKIVCETMEWIQKEIKIGMSEKEVAALVTYKMMQKGASKNSFDPIVASGVNGSFPHHKPSDKKIANNEFVTIDMGCIYNGYCSDLTRTFPIGKPDQRLIDAYNVVFDSNQTGIEHSCANIIGSDLDKICRDVISKTEFKDYFIHSTGHGVGIEVHEFPNVSKTYGDKILNNSIITIEPGIYLPNLGGIRIEDMVLINDKSPIVLTNLATKHKFN
ncbi:MAG: aminopeptidase P family protein [Malacoplasma sp.]